MGYSWSIMTIMSTPSDVKSSTITSDQVAAFHRDGYLVAPIFRAADLAPVQRELEAAIDRRARALHAEGGLAELHPTADFSTRYGLLNVQTEAIQHGFDVNQLRGTAMFGLMHHPGLLDALEALIGPEVSCNPIQHVRAKPPQHQTADSQKGYFSVPWHQDSGVNVPEADASDIITCWTALVDVTEDMGPLQVLPGAHRLGHLAHASTPGYGTSIKASVMPDIAPVRLLVPAGSVVFMHRHCPHHSTPNRSPRCRWSLDLRFHRTGDNSGRPWQPEFVVRSRAKPASVMSDHATWDKLWRDCLATPDGARIMHRVEA
jgi:phytanoyl-CoA hydroxylase